MAPGDGTADDRSRAHDDTVAWPAGEAPADRDPDVDVPLDDHDRDAQVDELIEDRGTFDDPRATGPSPDPAPEPSATGSAADDADEDRGTLDDPRVVSADGTSRAEAAEPEPEPEPVVAVAPAAVAGPAAFFPESETQPLRDRWRDIQLRFVDDPRATTAEAAALVDETIEKLTSSLRQHRASLAGGGDDTEALRMELRAYRDILDRLLGL
ncbi:hypothetical protein [Actinoplanes siamensis]|uniref:hypothetical protein n=1 Tax=Actinoplanes siamensis TaxID=1223317 RepID=UPI0036089186